MHKNKHGIIFSLQRRMVTLLCLTAISDVVQGSLESVQNPQEVSYEQEVRESNEEVLMQTETVNNLKDGNCKNTSSTYGLCSNDPSIGTLLEGTVEENKEQGEKDITYVEIEWGRTQIVQGGSKTKSILQVIEATHQYMTNHVLVEEYYANFSDKCRNQHALCSYWAATGECGGGDNNFMIEFCSPACLSCNSFAEFADYVPHYIPPVEQETEWDFMPVPWGEPQRLGAYDEGAIAHNIASTYDYMKEQRQENSTICTNWHTQCTSWAADGQCEETTDWMMEYCAAACETCHQPCQDWHTDCAFWASTGACETHKIFMMEHCTASCHACHLEAPVEILCPFNVEEPNVWQPGDLNVMFQRIITDQHYQQYGPINVLSRPAIDGKNDGITSADNNVKDEGGPWIVTLDNFLTEEECDLLIEFGEETGHELSSEAGIVHTNGTIESEYSERRTSTNTWCYDECEEHQVVKSVLDRMGNLTGIPYENSEWLQLLKYMPGQYYQEHHDYLYQHADHNPGPRILTIFLYLNDVEVGGGTHFNRMNMTVLPKRGRVVLWPSVYDDAPLILDERTHHEALPVEKGLKYGANAWIHQRPFKDSANTGCV